MSVYIDGSYFEKEDALVSVYDHGLLYGDGIFEGIRIYNGRVFRLKEHIRRLYDSARAILLTIPMKPEEMIRQVEEAVELDRKKEGYIRLVVTRGKGNLGIDPATCLTPSVIIIVDDIQLYPESCYSEGIRVVTASTRRLPPDGIDPRVKSLNYLNNILAKIEARQAGCLEAVMLNKEGYVSECTADNIFIVRGRVVLTPGTFYGALDGITRSFVLELAGKEGIETARAGLTRYDLYTSDECFLTGTGAEIMPVTAIDGRTIGTGKPGEITLQLKSAFTRYIREE